jgi:HTH-type transcriptional regulator/antitoxin HigA
MKKTGDAPELTPAQKAWCFRVKQISKSLPVPRFKKELLLQCERELRKIAPYSPEVRKVPVILTKYGIRFIVVEPLTGGKLDGVTMWLDDESPVIGMSLRFDRIDSFWQTLCHEFRHVWHHDVFSADVDMVADSSMVPTEVRPEFERRADREAAAMLVPQDELESFIRRVGPLYSKTRINQFANRIKVHPGIIVGQLQHRGEIGYSANREMLVKIRDTVTPVAITDGWGTTIDEGAL